MEAKVGAIYRRNNQREKNKLSMETEKQFAHLLRRDARAVELVVQPHEESFGTTRSDWTATIDDRSRAHR